MPNEDGHRVCDEEGHRGRGAVSHRKRHLLGFVRPCQRRGDIAKDDPEMRENGIADIVARLSRTFKSRTYMQKLLQTDVNWLDVSPQNATRRIIDFVKQFGDSR